MKSYRSLNLFGELQWKSSIYGSEYYAKFDGKIIPKTHKWGIY